MHIGSRIMTIYKKRNLLELSNELLKATNLNMPISLQLRVFLRSFASHEKQQLANAA